ncbi:Uu.00g033840.m01.CDS01 [Anthostomella pinea]|uniref:Uu.00g033840.m01.CDS01 n=1 Tax=Anthostomella pinea TaxID=933095 RepID=A0AAI8V9Y8_9PEZI|nr:Uu.00g033840.m01.CDS01 [Anthostomella pinea]
MPRLGGFVVAPQTHNGDEVMITVQRPVRENPETRWADTPKDHLRSLFRQNSERFPSIVRNAVRDIPSDQLHIWPFYQVPRLERWTSAKTPGGFGRVTVAFEDVYLFGRVLGRLLALGDSATNEKLQRALYQWQSFRQARVDQVLEINRQMDLRRMPGVEKEEELKDMGVMYERLFSVDLEKEVEGCLEGV